MGKVGDLFREYLILHNRYLEMIYLEPRGDEAFKSWDIEMVELKEKKKKVSDQLLAM